MITVYERDETDFEHNGLGPVDPVRCVVRETINGMWELELEHARDGLGKCGRLQIGNIIKAPVPAGYTPAITTIIPATEQVEIWQIIDEVYSSLYLRSGPGTSYKALGCYYKRQQVTVLSKTDAPWYEVTAPDGKHGWMHSGYMQYVKTAGSAKEAETEVREPRALREQPFRIYRIVPGLETVTVSARHIFYDLMDNIIDEYKPEGEDGATVAAGILSHCRGTHEFRMYSDLDSEGDADFSDTNPVEAILGNEGLCETWKGELARDWWDIYAVKRVGRDTDIEIRQGKNLIALGGEMDVTGVVTRIVPVGSDKDGGALYLPEVYVENTNDPQDYGAPKWGKLEVSEAKEGKDGMSKSDCYDKMRAAAAEEFEKGCDAMTVTLDVDFVNLGDTVEYADYGMLYDLSLGDSVRVISENAGIDVTLRLTEYEYDCLAKRYTTMKLGDVESTMSTSRITAAQLGPGSVTASKITRGAVTAAQIAAGSVTGDKLADGVIDTGEIADGAVTTDKLGSGAVTDAKVASSGVSAAKITSGTLDAARLPFKIAWGTVSATSSSATAPTMNYSAAGFTSLPSVVCSFAKEGSNDAGDWGSLKIFDKTLTGAKVVIGGSGGITKSVDWVAVGI